MMINRETTIEVKERHGMPISSPTSRKQSAPAVIQTKADWLSVMYSCTTSGNMSATPGTHTRPVVPSLAPPFAHGKFVTYPWLLPHQLLRHTFPAFFRYVCFAVVYIATFAKVLALRSAVRAPAHHVTWTH